MSYKRKKRRDSGAFGPVMRKGCKFCKDGIKKIDYKDVSVLSGYITEQGKILPGRITGTCSYHQRQLSKAIRRARAISLLPFKRE